MVKKWLFRIYILTFVFILGSAIYFRSFIYSKVIVPIAQFLWAIYRIFASVNQRVYWLVLIGFIILIICRIVFSVHKDIRDKYVTEFDRPIGREQFWLEAIANAMKNDGDSRKFLRRELGQLFLVASNLNALTGTENIETALLNLQPPLPTNLLSLIKESGDKHKKSFHRINFTFARHIFQWWRKRRTVEVAYKEIDATLQSMEDYLEINHEI